MGRTSDGRIEVGGTLLKPEQIPEFLRAARERRRRAAEKGLPTDHLDSIILKLEEAANRRFPS